MMSTAIRIGGFATVMALLVGGMIYSQSDAQPVKPTCVSAEERIVIRAATLAAIEDGLKDQLKFLFTGWIKDPTHQPARASAGLQNAIVVYQRAREDALKWNPEICGKQQ